MVDKYPYSSPRRGRLVVYCVGQSLICDKVPVHTHDRLSHRIRGRVCGNSRGGLLETLLSSSSKTVRGAPCSPHFIEDCFCFREIGHVEPFREPVIEWSKKLGGFLLFTVFRQH